MSLRAQSLKDIFTFTRASTATYWNLSGVMTEAAVDEPRIDYDPVTLVCRGLLIEEQRTNLILNSRDFATQNVTVTNVPHTLSFYGTGSIALTGTASPEVSLAGTGITTRVEITFTPTAGTLTLTLTGSAIYAQLEAGAHATSWLATTSAPVTRAADLCLTTTLEPWFSESAGTFFVEYMLSWPIPAIDGQARRLLQVDGGDDYESHVAAFVASDGVRGAFSYAGSTEQSSLTSLGSIAPGVVQKQAYAFAANDIAVIASGGSLATDTSAELSTALTTFRIGPAYQPNGYIRKVKFYPRRLSNTELAALVA
jgi:hypothetical protein